MYGRDVFLKVVLASESVLADVTLPIPALLFLRLTILAQLDGSNVAAHDTVVGDGIA